MKKEIADKWVEALRSGKYKQAKQRLHRDDAFCCLGVLCDISGQGEWYDDEYLFCKNYLPKEVMSWAEMHSHTGKTSNLGHLSSINDRGYTFKEIADIIEEYWQEL